ncbi:putative repeat protein (TIGR02543 family) [Lachnotalea glycerini]|uniref:Putative repeat protein (TIGR02543 family) n=1 Tax=Lachnotalea glycerini TaxID=1763509 RepID=A0A318EH42_9FIRM|nr:DUF5722 domain-containing protein [Lachnotalea glycerini]PXV85578.1 putative repeat protein (TIGR02543 family) [Lachnotalea glycerini]
MKGLFHKTMIKKVIPLLLLFCLLSESTFSSDIPTVYAETANSQETNTDSFNSTDETQNNSTDTTPVTNTEDDSDTVNSNELSTATGADNTIVSDSTDSGTDTGTDTTTNETVSQTDSSDTNALADESVSVADTDNKTKSKSEDIEISKETFPDEVFRTFVTKHFDNDKNQKLSCEEMTQVENIDVSNMGIQDLTGIEYFTNIVYLYCNGNKLKSLKLDTLSSMTVLDCSYNYLTSLDLSKCAALVSLECQNNAFTISLDDNNSYDLSTLKGFDIKNSSNWSESVVIKDGVLTLEDDYKNSIITYDYLVSAPLIEDTYLHFTMVIADQNLSDIEMNETTFPDEAFREYIIENFDTNEDSILTSEERNSITYLYAPEKKIASLSGIEYFPNLVFLNLDHNDITVANVNTFISLRSIYLDNNQLTDLQINELTNIEELYCSNNQLTSLTINPLNQLKKLDCSSNQLTNLDTTNLTGLVELYLNNNQLYCLDLSTCPLLELVECKDNVYELTSENNIVSLSGLELLDLTRTTNWSEGNLSNESSLLLDSVTDEKLITFDYMVNAPQLSDSSITFTIKVLPQITQAAQTQIEPQTQAEALPQVEAQTQIPATNSTPSLVSYQVVFNSDGGNEILSQSVQAGSHVVSPDNPVKSGYLFNGWYNGEIPYDFNTAISGDITLNAHWQQVTPPKPTIKSLKNSKKSKLKVNLKAAKNIEGYEISYSTNKSAKKNAIIITTNKTSYTIGNLVQGKTYYVTVRTYSSDSTGEKVYSDYSKIKKLKISKGLSEAKATGTSSTIRSCKITSNDNINVSAKASAIIKSSDNYYYLFALPSYKKSIPKNAVPLDSTVKATSFKFNTPLNADTSESQLYSKFVVAIKVKSGYKIISKAKYITNPQKIAEYTYSFPTASTKKGLQINAGMLNDVKDLGVKNSAFNIPLDMIIAAPGEDNHRNGIEYDYNGETYWFRKGMIAAYDSLFRQLKDQDIVVTAIILLGWRNDLTYLISPSGREEGHNYYNFNTSNYDARKQLEATFAFLAQRYASDSGNGQVVNWIIGNEVNSFDTWNYAGTKSLSKYAQLYADSYRLAYTAIKSKYSNARVYVSLDQCWTISNSDTFGGKEFLNQFDSILSGSGDIGWHLAYHAYPSPLTNPRFWKNENGLSENNEDTPVISISNINVLTNYIKKHYGKSTRIILSEQGFTSAKPYGEKTQAAAMAYAYYLAEFNPMIDAFILSRHVDNVAETNDGLNLGLWSNTPGRVEKAYQKKYSWRIYKYMDTPSSTKVTKFALKIIGASSWKKIVPKYKANKFKSMPNANE